MNTETVSVKGASLLERIVQLDLSPIKRKLMSPEPEGRGWTQEQAEEAEKWYRRYLHLVVSHPHLTLVPNGPIDVFWHQHILDTQKYAEDCQRVFSCFLHHYPYFGMNNDEQEFHEAFAMTNRLYREEFGEDCFAMIHFAAGKGAACSGQPCGNRCTSR